MTDQRGKEWLNVTGKTIYIPPGYVSSDEDPGEVTWQTENEPVMVGQNLKYINMLNMEISHPIREWYGVRRRYPEKPWRTGKHKGKFKMLV